MHVIVKEVTSEDDSELDEIETLRQLFLRNRYFSLF